MTVKDFVSIFILKYNLRLQQVSAVSVWYMTDITHSV